MKAACCISLPGLPPPLPKAPGHHPHTHTPHPSIAGVLLREKLRLGERLRETARVTQARIPPRVSSLPQFPAVSHVGRVGSHLGRVGPHLGSPPAQRTGYISSQVSRDSAWGLSCKLHLRTSASPPGGPCRPVCGPSPTPRASASPSCQGKPWPWSSRLPRQVPQLCPQLSVLTAPPLCPSLLPQSSDSPACLVINSTTVIFLLWGSPWPGEAGGLPGSLGGGSNKLLL